MKASFQAMRMGPTLGSGISQPPEPLHPTVQLVDVTQAAVAALIVERGPPS